MAACGVLMHILWAHTLSRWGHPSWTISSPKLALNPPYSIFPQFIPNDCLVHFLRRSFTAGIPERREISASKVKAGWSLCPAAGTDKKPSSLIYREFIVNSFVKCPASRMDYNN